jgi:hypothetical protein
VVGEFGVGAHGAVAAEGSSAHRGQEDVVLSPQHPFGHAGGAAGVDDVEILNGRPEAARPRVKFVDIAEMLATAL